MWGRPLGDRLRLEPLPPEEAVDFFAQKGFKPSFHWEEVWQAEHAAAFTVAKATQLAILTTIREHVDDAIRNGTTFEEFKRDLMPKLQDRGWWGRKRDPETGKMVQLGSPDRLRRIFQTNVRVAYAVGQETRAQQTKRTHPYFVYELGPSRHHRPEHESWAGTCLPVDHPWWDTHSPLNGWGCKCRKRQVTQAEAGRLGLKVGDVPAPFPKAEWKNKVTGEVVHVEEGIDPGWDYNPGKAGAARLYDVLSEKYHVAPFDISRLVCRSHVDSEDFRRWLAAPLPARGQETPSPAGDFPIAIVPEDLAKALGTKARLLRFSDHTRRKQAEHHPDLSPEDYLVAQAILEDAPAWLLPLRKEREGQHVRMIYAPKDGGTAWRLIFKATLDGRELFLQSLNRLGASLEKELRIVKDHKRIR